MAYSRQHFAALADLQRQLSTGLRFERHSQAPLDAARAGSLRLTMQNLVAERAQVPLAERVLNGGVSQLLAVQDLTTRAKQIALDAVHETDDFGREILAREVDGLIDQLRAINLEKLDGQYLFSGQAANTPPIEIRESAHLVLPHVRYAGSTNRASLNISASIKIDLRYGGDEVFFSSERGETLYFGSTGSRAGQGTDSGIGRAAIDIQHGATSYFNGSGVVKGLSSDAQDTIVGPLGRHTLTLVDTSGNGQFGTVSLNGGPVVNFNSSDTDLEVVGRFGEKVFIDTTAIAADFDGIVDIESTATISSDGGLTSQPVTFDANQILTNSFTQQVTHVDTTAVERVGRDFVEYTGSADLFTALFELRDDLKNSRGLASVELSEAFSRRAEDLQRASDRVLRIVGEQSVSLQALQSLQNRQADRELELATNLSQIQAADIAQVASDLKMRQSLIEANFASLTIVQGLSILDFLG